MSKKKSQLETGKEAARTRLQATGRNDPCPCGSEKKYKKCHLGDDEAATAHPPASPDPQQHLENGWRLFEQRRPGAAEKEFRAALALDNGLVDALVGIGMARLQAGDQDGARKELDQVLARSEDLAAQLEKEGVKDAFSRKEAQAYIRASHALGCLAYDRGQFEEVSPALRRVYAIDEGPVGTEARLVAAKALIKLGRPAESVPLLQVATDTPSGGGRALMGLVLAHFAGGDRAAAEEALARALQANPHFGKALLGRLRRRTDNLAAAAPGSPDEAAAYAQTYGDVWDAPAKAFLEEALTASAAKAGPAGIEVTSSSAETSA